MKKIILTVLAALLALSMIGCDKAKELINNATAVTAPTGETLYNALSAVIGSPDSSYYEDILGTITFTAKVFDEPFEMEIKDEDGKTVNTKFVTSAISRKYDNYFLVDISDIEYISSPGDIVTMTGNLDGSIYWTEENSKVEKLAFKASSITPYEGEKIEPLQSDTLVVSKKGESGEITFGKAYFTQSAFSNAYVLYFNFKNTGSTDTAPLLKDLEFYQDDVVLTQGIFSVEIDLEPNALEARNFGEKTYAGKTDYYYYILAPDGEGEIDPSLPLEICKYDDDFNLTYYWQIEGIVDGAEAIAA